MNVRFDWRLQDDDIEYATGAVMGYPLEDIETAIKQLRAIVLVAARAVSERKTASGNSPAQ